MKVSLKFQDPQTKQTNPLLFIKAKLPISILNLPFTTSLSAANTTPSHPQPDLSLSLSTNFPSGPSLSLSYTPTDTTSSRRPPLDFTLRSGIGLHGSPNNSPLVMSASFSFSPQGLSLANPTFLIHFKPKLGSFSLFKSVSCDENSLVKSGGDGNGKGNVDGVGTFGFVPVEGWRNLEVNTGAKSVKSAKDSILSGIFMMAHTEMPLTKRLMVNMRWGVNVPADETKLPYLRVNKIAIERVAERKGKGKGEEGKAKEIENEGNAADVEMLKGLCSWMRRELSGLQKENSEMKRTLEEMKMGSGVRYGVGGKKSLPPAVDYSGGFEQWRRNRSAAEEDARKEDKKNVNLKNDVESELQRAIQAASS